MPVGQTNRRTSVAWSDWTDLQLRTEEERNDEGGERVHYRFLRGFHL
jgi:hypothetical protein